MRDRACNGSRNRSVPGRVFDIRRQEHGQGLLQTGNGNAVDIVANISRHYAINLHWALSLICGPVRRTKYLNTMGGSFNGPQRDLDYCSKARCSSCHAGRRRLGMNMRKSTSVMLEAVSASYRTVFESSHRNKVVELLSFYGGLLHLPRYE